MSDMIGWVASAVIIFGSIDIAHKNSRGLWLMVLGNLLWAQVGLLSGLSSLVGLSLIMIGLDFYGLYRWKNDTEYNI